MNVSVFLSVPEEFFTFSFLNPYLACAISPTDTSRITLPETYGTGATISSVEKLKPVSGSTVDEPLADTPFTVILNFCTASSVPKASAELSADKLDKQLLSIVTVLLSTTLMS